MEVESYNAEEDSDLNFDWNEGPSEQQLKNIMGENSTDDEYYSDFEDDWLQEEDERISEYNSKPNFTSNLSKSKKTPSPNIRSYNTVKLIKRTNEEVSESDEKVESLESRKKPKTPAVPLRGADFGRLYRETKVSSSTSRKDQAKEPSTNKPP